MSARAVTTPDHSVHHLGADRASSVPRPRLPPSRSAASAPATSRSAPAASCATGRSPTTPTRARGCRSPSSRSAPARRTATRSAGSWRPAIQPPHEGDSGHHIGKVAGLPRLGSSRMQRRVPAADDRFHRRPAAGRGAARRVHPAGAPRRRRARASRVRCCATRCTTRRTDRSTSPSPDRCPPRSASSATTCSRCQCSRSTLGRRTVDPTSLRGLDLRHRPARGPCPVRHGSTRHGRHRRHRHPAVGRRLLAGRRPAVLGRLHRRRSARAPAGHPGGRLGAGPLSRQPAPAADRFARCRPPRSRRVRPATSSSS